MIKHHGKHWIGTTDVELITDSSHGSGSFQNHTITVGLKTDFWYQCLNVLMHEALEYCMTYHNTRFKPDLDYANASDGYVFVMDHNQFSEVTARAACFISAALPIVGAEYRKAEQERKKAAKPKPKPLKVKSKRRVVKRK